MSPQYGHLYQQCPIIPNFPTPISLIPLERTIRFHPKDNPPFSESSQGIQYKLANPTEIWET